MYCMYRLKKGTTAFFRSSIEIDLTINKMHLDIVNVKSLLGKVNDSRNC